MSYEYTDEHGDSLRVTSVLEEEFLVKVGHGSGRFAGISIPDEYAPAVALAILEAAGHRPAAWQDMSSLTADERLQLSIYHLKQSEQRRARDKERAEQSEREAEDAKVREFMRVLEVKEWEIELLPKEQMRRQYRTAREFFAKEDTPATTRANANTN